MPDGVLDKILQPEGNQKLQNPQIPTPSNTDTSQTQLPVANLPKTTWFEASCDTP